MSNKIKLRAVMLSDSTLKILDQDDREFAFELPYTRNYSNKETVQLEVSIDMNQWPYDKPRCEVKFSVPLTIATAEQELRIAEACGRL